MKPGKFTLEVENKLENMPAISDFVAETLANAGVSDAFASRVQVAIDEASSNVINYAYDGSPGTVKLTLEITAAELIITVADHGKPFNPLYAPTPDTDLSVEERPIGGLGIHLIKNLMDAVDYSYDPASGNELIMKKHLAK